MRRRVRAADSPAAEAHGEEPRWGRARVGRRAISYAEGVTVAGRSQGIWESVAHRKDGEISTRSGRMCNEVWGENQVLETHVPEIEKVLQVRSSGTTEGKRV